MTFSWPRPRHALSFVLIAPRLRAESSLSSLSPPPSVLSPETGVIAREEKDYRNPKYFNFYNPLNSWKQCNAVEGSEKSWLVCLEPQSGVAYWVCPIEDHFDGPPFVELESTQFGGLETSFRPCLHCPSQDPIYGLNCERSIENVTQIFNLNASHTLALLDMCTKLCELGLEGELCSRDKPCVAASQFCDFSSADRNSGVCQKCPMDINDCYEDGFLASETGLRDCATCELQCDDFGSSQLIAGGEKIASDFMHLAIQPPYLDASGPITDCSNLIHLGVDICEGARGKVCLVQVLTRNIKYWDLSQKAENSGCIAIILNVMYNDTSSNACGVHSYDRLAVPFICIADGDEEHLLLQGNDLEKMMARVEVQIIGQACQSSSSRGNICSEIIPCAGEDQFCPFDKTVVNGDYRDGWCSKCPTDGYGNPSQLSCYFDFYEGYARDSKYIIDCVESCNAQIEFGACKFCPSRLDSIKFGVKNEADKCHFCPNQDVQYPDRLVKLFGDNITCAQMQEFYESVDINKNQQNCVLAQKMNFVCGCQGMGYAGANTAAKQAALAWLPRMMAILSVLGSSFIVYDTLKTQQKRAKLLNQMLSTLSVFDIFGSIAYSFTTLPTPESDYLYGSSGNENTCIAQGFFIQIGTITCFLNVSLAVYYLLTIKYGWTHERLMSKKTYFFFPPIFVGLLFAFIGIPFYDNTYLWCNNAARYWPEIPIILAIASLTGIMCDICIHVYKRANVSRRYSSRRISVVLPGMVFKQAFWFAGSFYIAWVPYLALSYMWSFGKAFSAYGFILYAGSSVPLQGFWNFVVYARPRYFVNRRSSDLAFLRRVSLSSVRSSVGRLSFTLRQSAELVKETEQSGNTANSEKDKNEIPTMATEAQN